ncbi:hypothetical protein [Flavobacterium sp.]|uniref:hypothetical protein n=1 Tax=Flavobacterium sp. TaxID=239 RepID=UPI003D0AE635
MKKIIHVALLFFLCSVAFGQNPPPPDFEDPNDDNPTDQPGGVPIDSHLITLSAAALFLGFYIIWRKNTVKFNYRKEKTNAEVKNSEI